MKYPAQSLKKMTAGWFVVLFIVLVGIPVPDQNIYAYSITPDNDNNKKTLHNFSAPAAAVQIIDDFENGTIPSGVDGDGIEIGYLTWGDSSTTIDISLVTVSDSNPLAIPGQSGNNTLYQLSVNVVSWGITEHIFENSAVDTWVPQNWSEYRWISFWLYGQNTGNALFFEFYDNRNPGSTTKDVEIWNHSFTDNFTGWKLITLDFSTDFVRKEVLNGAPNDGINLDQVHGWSFGFLTTGGAEVMYYLDNIMLTPHNASSWSIFLPAILGAATQTFR